MISGSVQLWKIHHHEQVHKHDSQHDSDSQLVERLLHGLHLPAQFERGGLRQLAAHVPHDLQHVGANAS